MSRIFALRTTFNVQRFCGTRVSSVCVSQSNSYMSQSVFLTIPIHAKLFCYWPEDSCVITLVSKQKITEKLKKKRRNKGKSAYIQKWFVKFGITLHNKIRFLYPLSDGDSECVNGSKQYKCSKPHLQTFQRL